MSDALPNMTALLPPQATGQSLNGQAKTVAAQDEQGFPALFESLVFDSDGKMINDAGTMPLLSSPLALPTGMGEEAAFLPLSDTPDPANSPLALQMFTEQWQQAGNQLPQVNWSGVVAVADQDGALGLQLQGDEQGLNLARAVPARELPLSILQLQHALPGTPTYLQTMSGPELALQQQLIDKILPAVSAERGVNVDAPTSLLTPVSHTSAQFASLLDAAGLGAAPARATDAATQTLSMPLQHPQWGQQVGERVHWLIGQNIQQADLRLNPPELGSLEVRIQVQGDQANISFSSPHAAVRDALDAAMPRLREMLQGTGLTLGDVNVSGQSLAQHGSGHSGASTSQNGHGHARPGDTGEAEPGLAVTEPLRRGVGLVDLYA